MRRTRVRKRMVAATLTLAALFLAGSHPSWVDAQARAAVVLFSVLETPVLGDATRLLTPEPEAADTDIGGSPAYVYAPGGASGGDVAETYPAIVFINGTTPEGRELPAVRSLAEGLARSGFVVFVPDLAGLREDEISPETVSAAKSAVRAAADHPKTRGKKISLVGASTGATLALLVAKDAVAGDRVSSVRGLAPFTDIRTALSLATTGHHRAEDGRLLPYESDPFLSYAIARSLLAALPPGEDRDVLAAELSGVDRSAPDPLADLRRRSTIDLGPEARAAVRFLANEDPRRVDGLYRALPQKVRSDLKALSPLTGEGEHRGFRRARHRPPRQVLPALGVVRRRPPRPRHSRHRHRGPGARRARLRAARVGGLRRPGRLCRPLSARSCGRNTGREAWPGVALPRKAQGRFHLPRRLQHPLRQSLARSLPEPGHRSTRPDRRHDAPAFEDRRAYARHPLLALGHALGPTLPPDAFQDRGFRSPGECVAVLRPREQDFPG